LITEQGSTLARRLPAVGMEGGICDFRSVFYHIGKHDAPMALSGFWFVSCIDLTRL
jgi:hypothetical protein